MILQLVIKGHIAEERQFDYDQDSERSFTRRQREINRQLQQLEAEFYNDLQLTQDWQIHLIMKSSMRFIHYDLLSQAI